MTTTRIRMLTGAAITATALTAAPAAADVVTEWNQVAIQATIVPPNAMLQARVLAAVHVAMLEALQAASSLDPGGRDAAAAAAAYGVLSRLTSGQGDVLDAALKRTVDALLAGAAKTYGLALGTQTAERIVAQRRADGADAKVEFTPTPGAGRWQPTPPANAPAILPHWGSVKPFVLDSATRFPLKGPPKLDGPEFARDLNEVRTVGARLSTTRTADQTAAAIFWTVQTPVPWNAAARAAAAAHATTREENARLFAALNVACSDAHVAAFEAKYRLQHWRPITAIRVRAAPSSKDATWEPLIGTPAHPDYPSTHATCSGAAEAVLRGFFGSDEVAVSVTYPPVFGVTRSYTSFSQMVGEVDDARVWGGIHFRSADVDGRELGRRVGEYVLARFPAVTVSSNAVALAADNWIGTWKLDIAKSKFSPGPGPKSQTLKWEATPAGTKHTSDTINAAGKETHGSYTSRWDGRDVPYEGNPNADTASPKKLDDNTYTNTLKKAGRVTVNAKVVVAPDGKTLTITQTGKTAKGDELNTTAVFEKQ